MNRSGISIGILGTRGIPARYGGFETFAEELSTRLVALGYDVTVYGRRRFFERDDSVKEFRGVRLRTAPTIMHKYLETPLHALTSILRLFREPVDVVLMCNAANSPMTWLLRLMRIPFAINVDGIERKRAKWNWLGKLWYHLGERCAVLFANIVIADADVIADYYKEQYGRDTTVIAYGASAKKVPAGETLAKFELKPRQYVLYVSRLEPENNALGVIEAYRKVKSDLKLVIVGDAPYASEYKEKLRDAASGDDRIIFTGFQFGDAYHEFQSNCALYIQATEVGGTHPALIESMAHGNCVIANGTPENLEVIGDAAESYAANDFKMLSVKIESLLSDAERMKQLGNAALARARAKYSWEAVTGQYEELFRRLAPLEK